MQPPLTSLDPIDWLVWADYCAENDNKYGERFARRTARSLTIAHQRQWSFPARLMLFRCWVVPHQVVHLWVDDTSQVVDYRSIGGELLRVPANLTDRDRKSLRWLFSFWEEGPSSPYKGTPAELPDPYSMPEVCFRYFKGLNRRVDNGKPDKSRRFNREFYSANPTNVT